jgi:hypothetical protein
MPQTYYSREEINKILDEVRTQWIAPYVEDGDYGRPCSPEETMDILVGSLKDQFGIVQECPQRLILTLSLNSDTLARNPNLIVERSHVLKSAFAKRFPMAPKFREVTQVFPDSTDWKYYFSGAIEEHFKWAKIAKDCGLIDAYIVDYDPEWNEEIQEARRSHIVPWNKGDI